MTSNNNRNNTNNANTTNNNRSNNNSRDNANGSRNEISIGGYRVQTQTGSAQIQQHQIVNTEAAIALASNFIKVEKTEILNAPTPTTFLNYNSTNE